MGGTEVYVAALAQELLARDVQAIIAAPAETTRSYFYGDIPVRRFAVNQQVSDLRELYGEGDELAANEFAKILDEEQPEVVHFHAFTSGVSLKLLRAAKTRSIPVIFTYHTPTASCQRGTMMRRGEKPCDGLMDLHACARCTLEGLLNRKSEVGGRRSEIGKIAAHLLGSLPPALGSSLGKCGLHGGAWTALRMTELVKLRHATTRSFLAEVDHVVAVCDWVRQVLLRNGVPETKITLCRQGVGGKAESGEEKLEAPHPGPLPSAEREGRRQPSTLRLCFLGRLDPSKGIHILLQALRALPSASITLDIYGVAQGEAGKRYEQTLRHLADGDERIKFCSPVPANEIVETLNNYDMLAVPSQLLETGPLVVLEAFAAGVPVMGSRLGGITELVKDGENGILVEANSIESWTAALARLSSEPELLKKLRLGIRPPRTMSVVADEMLALYADSTKQMAFI